MPATGVGMGAGRGRRRAWTPARLPGLLAVYLNNDNTGTTATDTSGKGNHATLVGGAEWTNGGIRTGPGKYIQTPIPFSAVGSVVVYYTPAAAGSGGDVIRNVSSSVWPSPNLDRFLGSQMSATDQLNPQLVDDVGGKVWLDAAAVWPTSVGFSLPTASLPALCWVGGLQAMAEDDPNNVLQRSMSAGGNVRFGTRDNSLAGSPNTYHAAVITSRRLSASDAAKLHLWMAAQCAGRGITPAGPSVQANPVLVFVGNSLTANWDVAATVTPSRTYDLRKVCIGGATPQTVTNYGLYGAVPLKRAGSTKNVLVIWPSPNSSDATAIVTAARTVGTAARSAGFRVLLMPHLSCSGLDAVKNQVNAAYSDPVTGWNGSAGAWADAHVGPADVSPLCDDGNHATGNFADGVHVISARYADTIGPAATAKLNALP